MSSFQKVLELSIPQELAQHYWERTQEQNWKGCCKNPGQGRRKILELGHHTYLVLGHHKNLEQEHHNFPGLEHYKILQLGRRKNHQLGHHKILQREHHKNHQQGRRKSHLQGHRKILGRELLEIHRNLGRGQEHRKILELVLQGYRTNLQLGPRVSRKNLANLQQEHHKILELGCRKKIELVLQVTHRSLVIRQENYKSFVQGLREIRKNLENLRQGLRKILERGYYKKTQRVLRASRRNLENQRKNRKNFVLGLQVIRKNLENLREMHMNFVQELRVNHNCPSLGMGCYKREQRVSHILQGQSGPWASCGRGCPSFVHGGPS